ncbi:MAG: fumarate reductase subunit FrdD [Halioglobus sp.]
MKKYQRSHEPIVWSLFGGGGMVAAFLLPALILATGIIAPLGLGNPWSLSFHRVLAFSQTWWGALLILTIIALPLFHAAHRIYHGLHDLHIRGPKPLMLTICYGGASLLSGLALYWLIVLATQPIGSGIALRVGY